MMLAHKHVEFTFAYLAAVIPVQPPGHLHALILGVRPAYHELGTAYHELGTSYMWANFQPFRLSQPKKDLDMIVTVRRGKREMNIEVGASMTIAEVKKKVEGTRIWLADSNDKRKINGKKKLTLLFNGEELSQDQYFVSDYSLREGDLLTVPSASDSTVITPLCRGVTGVGRHMRRHSMRHFNSMTISARRLANSIISTRKQPFQAGSA
jgi:hypothetical protein